MENAWAGEHLEVIRTLMERAAVYRRALAPTALLTGLLGTGAAVGGWALDLRSPRAFGFYWIAVGCVSVVAALVVIRRQALRDAEPFWTLPTRRVTAAMAPPLGMGLVMGLLVAWPEWREELQVWWLPPLWMALYGCALHAAGFFMPRGIKLLGWLFLALGSILMIVVNARSHASGMPALVNAHWLMGAAFGGIHMAYGLYLVLTRSRPGPL